MDVYESSADIRSKCRAKDGLRIIEMNKSEIGIGQAWFMSVKLKRYPYDRTDGLCEDSFGSFL